MAYTRPWTKNNPPGSQAANTADDELRNLRQDTEERMTTLVTGWDTAAPTDPIVARPAILGNVTGKTLIIPASLFIPVPSGPLHLTVGADTTMYYGLILPMGVTVTQFSYLINNGAASGSSTLKLQRKVFDTTLTVTTLDTVTVTTGQSGLFNSVALTEVIDATKLYALEAFVRSLATFHGVRVTYNTPDCRNTL